MKEYENSSRVNDEVIKLYAEKSMTGNLLSFNLNKAKLFLFKSEEDCKKAFSELIEKNKDENNSADIYFEMFSHYTIMFAEKNHLNCMRNYT